MRTRTDLQELLSEVQEGAEEWGFGPPVLNLFGGLVTFLLAVYIRDVTGVKAKF